MQAAEVWPWYFDASLPGDVSFGGSMGTMFAPVGGISWGGVATDIVTDILGGVLGGTIGTSIANRVSPPGTVSTIPQRAPMSPVYSYPGVVARAAVVGRRTYRHMNACNPRALKRAIRRVKRFEKFAKQSIRISKKVKAPRKRTCR